MVEIGTISQVRGDRARVAIGSMVTDFLIAAQAHSNSYALSFSPIRAGEQVLVLPIRGELNSGVILRGLFQDKHKAEATNKKEHITFEDGTKISYDTSSSTLEVASPKVINVIAKNVSVKADETTIKSPSIKLFGDVDISGDVRVKGNISDSRGDLTGHSHSDSDGGVSNPR